MDKKGIPYFKTVSPVPRYQTFDKKGYKNIYTVVLEYWHDSEKRTEKVNLCYGDFKAALERSNVEMDATPGWGGVHLVRAILSVATYRGTKKLHEEVLVRKTKTTDNKWESEDLM